MKFNFVKYSHPLIFPLKELATVKLASVKEIALMKAFTLGQRAMLKDYVDLYFILKNNYITLEEILRKSEKKYGEEFNGRLFLQELTYLEDVREIRDEERVSFLKKPVSREEMVKFFEKEIKKIRL